MRVLPGNTFQIQTIVESWHRLSNKQYENLSQNTKNKIKINTFKNEI